MRVHLMLEVPDGASTKDVEKHVKEAVKNWGGSYPPDDLFFPNNVEIRTCQATVLVSPRGT